MIDPNVKDDEALEIIRRAMAQVVLRLRLIGLTYLGRSIVIKERFHKTMATNGRQVFYNPDWVLAQTEMIHVEMALVHEWLHIFGNDCARAVGREREIWQIAIDMVVNAEVEKLFGQKVPPTWIQPEPWTDKLSKEEVYFSLLNRPRLPAPGLDLLDDVIPADSIDQLDDFVHDFRGDLAGAMEIVRKTESDQAIKQRYGDRLMSRFEKIVKSRVPFSRLLRGRLDSQLRGTRQTWAPPCLRHWPDMITPSFRSKVVPVLVIAVDVSGSVDQSSLNEFISNVEPAAARAKECYVVVFDDRIRESHKTNRPRDILSKVKFLMGSHTHTSTVEVFAFAQSVKATSIVVETDGIVKLPDTPFPETTWVLNNDRCKMPWGTSYVLERGW